MNVPPSLTGMSHLNTAFDPDIDSFLNLDQADYSPLSPSSSSKLPSLSHQSSTSSASYFGNTSAQQTFSGPSFQYDAHRQQTGLPVGGLANTFAVNQASGLQYYDGQGGFVMPTETLNIPLSKLDDFDFARHPSLDISDMDFDAESPSDMPTMFYPNNGSSQAHYVTPNTLVASGASATSTPVQRVYPGMHSQQAAQAKAEQAQKQQELMRQQQQPRQIPGQKPLPSQPKSQTAKDPLVEESISRLLSQMRQNSVASTNEDDGTPTNGSSNMPRIKKDEDEMDEDERLLASEEGKKLSSKERRQLRNKVSARAFRSRRKEYIGQLEGELAVKVQEATDLRGENRQLRDENTRLTDLTRMLLSSQAFSGFLSELSQSGLPANGSVSALQQQHTAQVPQPQPTRKDINPHDAVRQMKTQQEPQIGMALMPEPNIDMSLFDTPWNSAVTSDYHVYALTELPEAPVLDMEKVSGKSKASTTISTKPSKDIPSLSSLSEVKRPKCVDPVVVDESIPLDENSFSLFFDALQHEVSTEYSGSALQLAMKPHFIPVLATSKADSCGSWESLEALCAGLEETSERLAALL